MSNYYPITTTKVLTENNTNLDSKLTVTICVDRVIIEIKSIYVDYRVDIPLDKWKICEKL